MTFTSVKIYFQRRSGKERKDLQIMTLENEKLENLNVGSILGETFRLEGNAEILQVCPRYPFCLLYPIILHLLFHRRLNTTTTG